MYDLVSKIKRLWKDKDSGEIVLYQPLEHPDLKSYRALQPCEERLDLILDSLYEHPKTIVDLGCNMGWFCRAFSKLGCKAIGIDRKEFELKIASELMAPWNGRPTPTYILGDLHTLDIPESDVVLCLSIVMYLFDDLTKGWDLLRKISESAPKMFLDFGGQYSQRVPFNKYTAVPAILQHTAYTEGVLIGRSNLEDRPLYEFNR